MRTRIYVDGYNLYYGALKPPLTTDQQARYGCRTLKWLDLSALARHLFPTNTIDLVRYFTARIRPIPWQSVTGPKDQAGYLAALETCTAPRVETHYGHFAVRQTGMRTVQDHRQRVQVWKAEEKGSDVNLASFLVKDVYEGNCEAAVIISNDSDLEAPIRIACEQLASVGIVHPGEPRHRSRRLWGIGEDFGHFFARSLRRSAVAQCQFAPKLTHPTLGVVMKPANW